MTGPAPSARSPRSVSIRSTALVVACSLLMVGVVVLFLLNERAAARFEADLDTVVSSTQRGIAELASQLDAVDGFFRASNEVTTSEFIAFTTALRRG